MVTIWCPENCLYNSRIFFDWNFLHSNWIFLKTYRYCPWSNLHQRWYLHGWTYNHLHWKHFKLTSRRDFKSSDSKVKDQTLTFKTVTKMGIHHSKCNFRTYLYKMEIIKSLGTHYLDHGQLYLILWSLSSLKLISSSLNHKARNYCQRH